jgi:hypothetical protein
LGLRAEGGRPWSLHAWSPAFPFSSSETGKWAELLTSEEPEARALDCRPSPLCRRVAGGGSTATREMGDVSRQP